MCSDVYCSLNTCCPWLIWSIDVLPCVHSCPRLATGWSDPSDRVHQIHSCSTTSGSRRTFAHTRRVFSEEEGIEPFVDITQTHTHTRSLSLSLSLSLSSHAYHMHITQTLFSKLHVSSHVRDLSTLHMYTLNGEHAYVNSAAQLNSHEYHGFFRFITLKQLIFSNEMLIRHDMYTSGIM